MQMQVLSYQIQLLVPEGTSASTIICGHLVSSLRKRATFNGTEHTSVIKEGWAAIRLCGAAVNDSELKCLLWNLPPPGEMKNC
eukprot:scaffold21500_cov58-Attheya_sp.AAC.3